VGLAIAALYTSGCSYTPNAYLVPRAIAPGTIQAGISLDAIASPRPGLYHVPTTVIHARYGLTKRVELTAAATIPFTYAIGTKVEVLRSRSFDVAWVARTNLSYWWVPRIDYRDFPEVAFRCPYSERYCRGEWVGLFDYGALLGANISSSLTLVLNAGLTHRFVDDARIAGRIGLGVQWRLREIAIQPEVTLMSRFSDLNDRWIFYGLALMSRNGDGY
jgi:hypothetical protein